MRPLNFLYPLSLIYRLIISIRNFAYNSKIFKIYKVNTKIISIGNITAGGSGKTPFTIFLAKLLQNEGKNVAILSRGYGRKSKGWVLVHDGKRRGHFGLSLCCLLWWVSVFIKKF